MQTIHITVQGTSPILMNNPAGMGAPKSVGKRKSIPAPEEEAESKVYRNQDGKLAFPVYNFIASLVRASSGKKVGKESVVPYVCGCITPDQEFAEFGVDKYEIDTRRAVVQRQGVIRARPKISKWKLTFPLQVNDEDMPDGLLEALPDLVEEAGKRVGIGDFRPATKGPYGRFKLVKVTTI